MNGVFYYIHCFNRANFFSSSLCFAVCCDDTSLFVCFESLKQCAINKLIVKATIVNIGYISEIIRCRKLILGRDISWGV